MQFNLTLFLFKGTPTLIKPFPLGPIFSEKSFQSKYANTYHIKFSHSSEMNKNVFVMHNLIFFKILFNFYYILF